MDTLDTTPWDSAEPLRTDAEIALYLEAAMDEGDAELIAHALGTVARAQSERQQRGGEGAPPRTVRKGRVSPSARRRGARRLAAGGG